ncbi:MAG: hypothetical protein HQL72_07665 [Magnetococcales bacterium]|nr:hypothetical protein [Magnetococcales bacterium]
MKNPFHLLNLPPDVSDETVEAAYQRLITLHTAQHSTQRHQEIEWAYQTIKAQRDRIRFQLLETPTADIPTLLGPALTEPTPAPPNQEQTLAVLSHALKTFKIAMPDSAKPAPVSTQHSAEISAKN